MPKKLITHTHAEDPTLPQTIPITFAASDSSIQMSLKVRIISSQSVTPSCKAQSRKVHNISNPRVILKGS
jgi:hypothetical protein